MRFCGLPSSFMPIGDGHNEVLIGLDFGRKLVAENIHDVQAGKQPVRIRTGEALLGKEHQSDHHQRHMMMPAIPAPDLIVRHAASALGILERPFHEMAGCLHRIS